MTGETKYALRLTALTNHLTGSSSTGTTLEPQDCAATQVSSFARTAASDAKYARPAQLSFSRDDRVKETALLYGVGPMQEAAGQSMEISKAPRAQAGKAFNYFLSVEGWRPQVHCLHRRTATIYIFLLPGVKAGDIKLQVRKNCLTVSGRRIQGISYTETQHPERPIEILAEHAGSQPGGPRELKLSGGQPVLEQGQFKVQYVLPEGNVKGMKASFANERLRILVPSRAA